MSDDWWRKKIPDTEQVLWHGRPDQGYFPPRLRWAYRILIACLALSWIASPWFAETVRDYWKLIGCTLFLAFFMWWERLIRTRRVYVVTNRNVWWISEIFKAKSLSVHPDLKFYRNGHNIVFSHLRFLVFEYLPDPDAAMEALTKAREAQT
ncbi:MULTISPECIES: hypothetical protein [unclassified Ruegeria]|uniref:hypothetical protein n=1 Tax=unclassified Ruegeria TaxID=2625375 RepID=UPI001AD9BEBD|nr:MULTISPECIES: hypothetical protein [unclassified Ruegeria]MBO9411618.1 hypothetical protein [Ruegeria sp. R8_1]MBO9415820.1 hypothetical protein [Ruegeria sp. R8_2]